METTVKPLPGSQVQVTITLEPAEVNSFFDKVYQRLSHSGRIRGFRPGKAPKSIVRHVFGEDQIKASTYVQIIEELLPKALESIGRRVLGEPALPAFEEVALAENMPVTLPITVSVYPEAQVGDLGEMKILRPSLEVTDKEVQEVLEELREQKADFEEVTRAVAPGDRVTADIAFYEGDDLKSTQQGVTFEAVAPQENEEPTVASKVIGHFVGQTVIVESKGDDEAGATGDATGRVEATIRKVEQKVLPELSDDFARSVGDYESLGALEEDIRSQLTAQKQRRAWERMESQALAYLLAATDVELPEILLQQVTAARLEELDEDIRGLGSSLQELAAAGTLDIQKVEDAERQRATVGLEVKLALEALAKRENLQPEEQDIEAEIDELARRTRNDVEFVRQAYELQDDVHEQIDNRAMLRRAVRWIIDKAQLEEVPDEEFDERYRQLLEELEQRRRQRREAKARETVAQAQEADTAQPPAPVESGGQPGATQVAETTAAEPPAEPAPSDASLPEETAGPDTGTT